MSTGSTEPLSNVDAGRDVAGTDRRPVAVVGASDSFATTLPNVVVTALSADTAIRSGFDVFLLQTPRVRREAQELIFLAEEAGVRLGLPRGMRKSLSPSGPHQLVSVIAGGKCPLPQLIDLGLWLSGNPGVQRLEAFGSGDARGLSLRAHTGSLITIQRTAAISDIRVFLAAGPDETEHRFEWDPVVAREEELARFTRASYSNHGDASGATPADGDTWVSLEDSLEVVSVLERVHARVR